MAVVLLITRNLKKLRKVEVSKKWNIQNFWKLKFEKMWKIQNSKISLSSLAQCADLFTADKYYRVNFPVKHSFVLTGLVFFIPLHLAS